MIFYTETAFYINYLEFPDHTLHVRCKIICEEVGRFGYALETTIKDEGFKTLNMEDIKHWQSNVVKKTVTGETDVLRGEKHKIIIHGIFPYIVSESFIRFSVDDVIRL